MNRWLAIYVDKNGVSRAALIKPAASADMPFGVDEFDLGLDCYDGEPVTLVSMPDEAFVPTVVDVEEDRELPIQFIDRF